MTDTDERVEAERVEAASVVAPVHPLVWVALAAAFVGGAWLRWWVLRSPLGATDLDEATVGLQARAFTDGHLNVFFASQTYGGTFETGLVAVALAGPGDDRLALKLVPTALHLVACVIVGRVARRLDPSSLAPFVAPTVLWVGSAFGAWWSTKERGFYGVAIALAALLLLLVLRVDEGQRRRDVAALGLCLGLCVWTTPLLAANAIPTTAWLLARRPSVLRQAPIFTLSAVVGALPWLWWNVRRGWASLGAPHPFGSSWWQRFGDWFDRLPTLAGTATPWVPERTLVPDALVLLALAAAIAVASRRTWTRAPGLLLASVVGYALVYPFNTLAIAVGPDVRYVYPLLPLLAVIVAVAVSAAVSSGRIGRQGAVRAGVLALLAAGYLAASSWGLVGFRDHARTHREDVFLTTPGLDGVIDLLDQRQVSVAVSNSVGAQITFATEGRITVSSFALPRFPELEEEGERRGTTTYVLRTNEVIDDVPRFERWLVTERASFERVTVGEYEVFFLDEPVHPDDVGFLTLFRPPPEPR